MDSSGESGHCSCLFFGWPTAAVVTFCPVFAIEVFHFLCSLFLEEPNLMGALVTEQVDLNILPLLNGSSINIFADSQDIRSNSGTILHLFLIFIKHSQISNIQHLVIYFVHIINDSESKFGPIASNNLKVLGI